MGNYYSGTYLQGNLVRGYKTWGKRLVSKTADYTALITDEIILVDATAGNVTITLPAAASNSGKEYIVKKTDNTSNIVIIDGNSTETIDGALTQTIQEQYGAYKIITDASNWYIV